MAAAQPARFGASGDDISDWMTQRWRDIANLGSEAEDAGRRLWAQATRSGQDISAPDPSDVYALGAQFLGGGTTTSSKQADPSRSTAPDPGDNSTDDGASSDDPSPNDDMPYPLAFGQDGLLQLVAAPGQGFWDKYFTPQGCINCHGRYTPGTTPPVWGQTPLPPDYSQRQGSSGSSSQPEWSDKPQCNQQYIDDRKICQRAHFSTCWANSTERLGVCNRTDKVGTPPSDLAAGSSVSAAAILERGSGPLG